jgi:hypothetical protein
LTSPPMGEGTVFRLQAMDAVETGAVNTDRMNERGANNEDVQAGLFVGNTFHYDQLNGGTGEYGPTQTSNAFQLTRFVFAPRGGSGPDVTVVDGAMPWDLSVYPNSNWGPGNLYGDWKTDNETGREDFDNDIFSGKLPSNTQMLPYNPFTLTLSPAINPKESP